MYGLDVLDKEKVQNFSIGLDTEKLKNWGLDVVAIESKAVSKLSDCIDDNFVLACRIMLECNSRVIVIGMGKSGHIAKKIAATLSSTGTPAFSVHPAEAIHGDLGMITKGDVVLALSNSGETGEIVDLLPHIKRIGVKLISISGNRNSTLGKHSDCSIEIKIEKEACSLGLAPTTSTTTAMVIGDALAVSLLNARGFSKEDFAKSHPGGSLGKKLLIQVKDLMHVKTDIPRVTADCTVLQALEEMSKKRLGMTTIVDIDDEDSLLGIFTDGDLRRLLSEGVDVKTTLIKNVMIKSVTSVTSDILGAKALQIMEQHKILVMPVVDDGKLVGAFNMHDLFKAGVA